MRRLMVVALGFGLTMCFAFTDLCPPATAQTPTEKNKKVVLPEYEVLDEEVYDGPIKTQVTRHLLVSGEITADGLRVLIENQYDSVKGRRGFKYHKSPTNIYIYTYTTKERYEGGMGQWIAMAAKSYSDTKPWFSISEGQLAQLGTSPTDRFGMSENERKEVWRGTIIAERKAMKKSEQRYPIKPGDDVMPLLTKQMDLRDRLQKQYKEALAKKHGLTRKQLDEITVEGIEKDWPFPKR